MNNIFYIMFILALIFIFLYFVSTYNENFENHIIHISHNFGGGTENYVNMLTKILKNHKHKKILTTKNYVPKCKYIIIHSLLYDISTLEINKEIFNSIKNNKAKKILIIHDFFLLYPKNPNFLLEEMTTPDYDTLNFARYVLQNVDIVLYNSKDTLNIYNRFLNFDYNKIIINSVPDIFIYNSEIYPIKKEKYNVGILGNMSIVKGLNFLQFIVNNNNLYKYTFKIFGNNNISSLFQNKDNIKNLGGYNNEEIFEKIKNEDIDCFLFLSQAPETYSYTLSIAIHTGKPIFYIDRGAFVERLTNRKNCYKFSVNELNNFDNVLNKIESISNNNYIDKYNSYDIDYNIPEFKWILNDNNPDYFDIDVIKKYLNYNKIIFCKFVNTDENKILEKINNIKEYNKDKIDFIFVILLGFHVKIDFDYKVRLIYYSDNINNINYINLKDYIKTKLNNITILEYNFN